MATATLSLTWLYEAGLGVGQSLPEAARRFELAANAGLADAQYAMAVMLRTGKGRAHDPEASTTWLRKAAAQNHPASRAALQSAMEAAQGAKEP